MTTTFNIQKVKALKHDEKCWGCGDTLPKGTSATLHLERGEGKGLQIEKSYWCDCCVAYSLKFGSAYGDIDEGDFKESPLYQHFRAEWEKENKKGE